MGKAGIVAFAYGAPHSILSNRHIARIASQKARNLDAPVYTQLDVYIGLGVSAVFRGFEEIGNPPPTLRMARGAVQWAKRLEITEIWVAAAKPHVWRCLRDLVRADMEANGGVATLAIRICEDVYKVPDNDWFCSDSLQERTRSRRAWNKRECIVRFMPFSIYKRVAS